MSLVLAELEAIAQALPLGFCALPSELLGRIMLVAHMHAPDPKRIETLELSLRKQHTTGVFRQWRLNAVGIHAIKAVCEDLDLTIRTQNFELELARLMPDELKAVLLVYVAQIVDCNNDPRVVAKVGYQALQYWWRAVNKDRPNQTISTMLSYITHSCLIVKEVTVTHQVKTRLETMQ